MLSVIELTKYYDKRTVVDHINFTVEKGQMFSLLGANGAGKSTTIDMLCTIIRPDSGTIRVNGYQLGKDNQQIRNQIGIVFQESLLDPALTVLENLTFRSKFYHKFTQYDPKLVNRAVAITSITPLLHRYYGTLSGGEKRRVDIARALLHIPQVLILDEPTTGLDPKIRKDIWNTINRLKQKENMTILFTTHYMDEVDEADQVAMMEDGKIIAMGTPKTLERKFCHDIINIKPTNTNIVKAKLKTKNLKINEKNGIITVPIKNAKEALPILTDIRDYLDDFEVKTATMEEVFMRICGGILL